MKRLVLLPLLAMVLASPAHAQERSMRYSTGYAFAGYLNEDVVIAPFGLFVSGQSRDDVGLAGEVAYHHHSEDFEFFDIVVNSFTAMVGPCLNSASDSPQYFAHLLFGGRYDRVEGEGSYAIGGAFGVGLDIPAGTSIFVRLGADLQLFTDEGEALKVLRLTGGVAF